jgi:hypothetical protein
MTELLFHSLILLHGVVLNELSTVTTLSYLISINTYYYISSPEIFVLLLLNERFLFFRIWNDIHFK